MKRTSTTIVSIAWLLCAFLGGAAPAASPASRAASDASAPAATTHPATRPNTVSGHVLPVGSTTIQLSDEKDHADFDPNQREIQLFVPTALSDTVAVDIGPLFDKTIAPPFATSVKVIGGGHGEVAAFLTGGLTGETRHVNLPLLGVKQDLEWTISTTVLQNQQTGNTNHLAGEVNLVFNGARYRFEYDAKVSVEPRGKDESWNPTGADVTWTGPYRVDSNGKATLMPIVDRSATRPGAER